MLFTILEEDGRLHQQEPQTPISLFGTGEAHAIAVAKEQDWTLLINDQRPLVFAESLGVSCICVPDFCVFLYAQGKITMSAALGYLERLKPTTSVSLITRASQMLEKYTEQNGG